MGYYDFHIHTKNSGCCKEDYKYSDVWSKIKECDLDGFGVSDHCNYPSYKPEFIYSQKESQKSLGIQDKGLVGLEVSIYNKKGRLGISEKYLNSIDYKIVSEHIHIAKLFSGFFTTKTRVEHWLKKYKKKKSKIDKQINRVLDMELRGIRKNPNGIFAHIFRFPLNVNYVPDVLFERLDEILNALADNHFALEIHSGHVHNYNLSDGEARQKIVAGEHTHKEFYHYLYKRAKKYSLPFSLGSDAHRINDIKSRKYWKLFLNKIQVKEDELISPQFFREYENKKV